MVWRLLLPFTKRRKEREEREEETFIYYARRHSVRVVCMILLVLLLTNLFLPLLLPLLLHRLLPSPLLPSSPSPFIAFSLPIQASSRAPAGCSVA